MPNDTASRASPSSPLRTLKTWVKRQLQQAAIRHGIVGPSDGYRGHPDQRFGGSTYAQFGEDLIVLNIFAILGIATPSYLDIGAHHPVHVSNTALLHKRGSRGINVEANPNLIGAFQAERPEDTNLNVGVGAEPGTLDFFFIDDWSGRNTFRRDVAEDFVREHPQFRIQKVQPIPVMTINQIVDQHAGGRFPDFLSIDVEGLDFDILNSARFGAETPEVICVEAVSGADSDDSRRLLGLLDSKGYALFTRTISNLIMVRKARLPDLGLATPPQPV